MKIDESEFRIRVKHWMLDHGELTYKDLAELTRQKSSVAFAEKTIRQVMSGTYHGDVQAVKKSIREAIGWES